ncbi:uncharacterized protein B0H64DRAFT_317581 [Chaetomium fimeti]|uniref:Uncharacterized protein n=1 Tax=Chaetomium fimeti TaxID=1854472 RepID=A0AAE0HM70_9PEZI|nr:hypothetical protein B0H64DRAFT_317581 [Chaetomium fimeti]
MPEEWTKRHAYLSALCRSLRDTDFHEWGFVIYRGVYGDDDAWNSFLQCLRDNVHLNLRRGGAPGPERGALLERYAQWTVIEDRATLDGASRDVVRQKFVRWREGRIVTRKRSPNFLTLPCDPKPLALPRFAYCLYVDHECLATLGPHLAGKPSDPTQPHFPPPPLVAILIDGDYVHQPDVQGPFPPIDGSTARYVGWEYSDTRYICSLYEDLIASPLDDYSYRRPPALTETGSRSMPLV